MDLLIAPMLLVVFYVIPALLIYYAARPFLEQDRSFRPITIILALLPIINIVFAGLAVIVILATRELKRTK